LNTVNEGAEVTLGGRLYIQYTRAHPIQDRRPSSRSEQSMGSASSSRLVVPMFRLSKVGSRTFNISRPRIWNGLPENVVSAPTFSSFQRRLKPFLFQQSYPDIVI